MKKILMLFTLLVSFLISSVAMAAGTAIFRDDGNYLKPQERQQVQQALQQVADKHNIRVIGQITRRLPSNYDSARSYARTIVDKTFAAEPTVMFYIDMGTRNWYLAANRHLNKPAITQNYGVDYINNGMQDLLKKGQYAKAFLTYGKRVDELMTFAKEHGHAHTADDDFNLEAMLGAIVIAGIIAYFVRVQLIESMSNVHPAVEASEYLVEGSFELTDQNDRYLYTHTTVVPKSKNDSSDSGSDSDGDSGGSGGGGSF